MRRITANNSQFMRFVDIDLNLTCVFVLRIGSEHIYHILSIDNDTTLPTIQYAVNQSSKQTTHNSLDYNLTKAR